MYAWFWRKLPGPIAARIGVYALLVAIAVVVLFSTVFPWVETHLPLVVTGPADVGS